MNAREAGNRLSSERKLVLDVTAVSRQTFLTGVQRVVREFVEARDDVVLVKFQPRTGLFRIVPRLSKLRYRRTVGTLPRLRIFLQTFYWSSSKQFREQGSRRGWLPRPVRDLARWVYDKFLSDTYLEKREHLRELPIWHPEADQTFLLMDIPVSPTHLDALAVLTSDPELHFIVFLHDLFPLSHKNLFDPKHHPGVRARHLRYLDVVVDADEVVCNSEFTRGQFEQFVRVLEDYPNQIVRTVYLPWPTFGDGSTNGVRASEARADPQVRILAVGGLDQRKNMVVLVRAVTKMMEANVDVTLVIAAGGSSVSDPHLRAAMLGLTEVARERILVVGSVSNADLVAMYDECTVVAVPSLAEGFGLPIVEALARSRPVVASNTTAIPELAKLLPMTLVAPADVEGWIEALTRESARGFEGLEAVPSAFPSDWADFGNRVVGSTPVQR